MADLDHFSEITEETMDGEAPAGEEQERAEDGEEKSDMEELTALCERLLIRTMAMQNSLVDLHAEIKENRMEYNRDRKNMWLVLTDLDEARQEFLDEKKKRKEAANQGGILRSIGISAVFTPFLWNGISACVHGAFGSAEALGEIGASLTVSLFSIAGGLALILLAPPLREILRALAEGDGEKEEEEGDQAEFEELMRLLKSEKVKTGSEEDPSDTP